MSIQGATASAERSAGLHRPRAKEPRSAAPSSLAPRDRRRLRFAGWGFVSPSLVGLVVFTFVPAMLVIALSFSRWDVASGLKGIVWIGLSNYRTLLSSSAFWHGALLTGIYIGVTVPVTLGIALVLATGLEAGVYGAHALRVVVLIPFVMNQVAVAGVWIILYSPQFGLIDHYLNILGITNPPAWIASPTWALPALMIMAVWGGVGFATLFYSAALQSIPAELHEAAKLDGASGWKRFMKLTIPLLSPTTLFLAMANLIFASQGFGLVNLMTQGGPGTATNLLSFQIYEDAFQYSQYGYASALALLLFVGVMVVAGLIWLLSRSRVFYR